MTESEIALLLFGGVSVLMIGWYAAANQVWYRLVRDEEPAIHVDPVAEPVRWARTAPSRFRRMTHLIRTPASHERVELWRRRTINRLVAAVLLVPLVALLGPIVISAERLLLTTESQRGGAWAVVMFGLAGAFGYGYFAYRLARAAHRFGNAEPVRRTEFLVSIYGIVAFVVGSLFIALTPVGS